MPTLVRDGRRIHVEITEAPDQANAMIEAFLRRGA